MPCSWSAKGRGGGRDRARVREKSRARVQTIRVRQCLAAVQAFKDGFGGENFMFAELTCFPSPTDSFKSRHLIEMRIVCENWQSVLPRQSGNPKIVLRNGLAGPAELMTDVSVDTTGF